jgi:anti-sigma factor RsiW
MKTEEMLRLQAYLDNEVSSAEGREIASWLARDAEAAALYEELKATKTLLAPENEPVVTVPDSREFYWSKITREIERTEREPAREIAPRPWWIRILAPVAGAAALALILFTSISTNPRVSSVHQERSDLENGTITFRSKDNSMTLVWISSDGSETAQAVPASDISDDEDFE